MKTSVQTVKAGVDELLTFLSSTEHETALTGLLLQRRGILNAHENTLLSQISEARTDRKRYIYTVSIISLYGLLERFVDNLIEAFIACIANSVSSFAEMPANIQENHIPMSIALVKAIGEDRHRTAITQKEAIDNLHSCLSGDKNFRVNGAAFVLHRGNITLAKITEFLTSIGIDAHLRRITLAPEFISFFQEKERDIHKVADSDLHALLQPINDLVDRRNQVSHGVIDDIESVDLLKERCHFITAYSAALYNVMTQEVLKYRIKHPDVQFLGKPIVVHNNSIVCFESNNCHIATGNIMVASTSDTMEPFRYGQIHSLQIEDQPLEEITISQPTKFGAKVSFSAKDHYEYYILPIDAYY